HRGTFGPIAHLRKRVAIPAQQFRALAQKPGDKPAIERALEIFQWRDMAGAAIRRQVFVD
ncbi:MAG: hypothetical protein OSB76_16750, partial [Alphaproteobacteria bacterium]|nr:hypothetical protein [Alphaproteobacteria bacterium]